MDPDACKLLGTSAGIDLGVKERRNGLVVERDADGGDLLADRGELLDEQQVVGRSYPEATDLDIAAVPEVQQFRPGRWTEP